MPSLNNTWQSHMVTACFQKHSDAENAVCDLQAAGFRSDQITSSTDDAKLTSDEYSPNSATASTAAHAESAGDRIRDVFSGKTADSDLNDNYVVEKGHADITARAYKPTRFMVMVDTPDRVAEAKQVLVRHHGEIDPQYGSAETSGYVTVPNG
jgi:hypothetical protein